MLRVHVQTNAQALRVFDACYGQGVTLWNTWPGFRGHVLWVSRPVDGLREALAQALPNAHVSEMKP